MNGIILVCDAIALVASCVSIYFSMRAMRAVRIDSERLALQVQAQLGAAALGRVVWGSDPSKPSVLPQKKAMK